MVLQLKAKIALTVTRKPHWLTDGAEPATHNTSANILIAYG